MSTNQIKSKIEALLEWEKIMEEAKAEADALRDEIKQEMVNRNTEELTAGQYANIKQKIAAVKASMQTHED